MVGVSHGALISHTLRVRYGGRVESFSNPFNALPSPGDPPESGAVRPDVVSVKHSFHLLPVLRWNVAVQVNFEGQRTCPALKNEA